MNWNQWYAIRSQVRSSLWAVPLLALLLARHWFESERSRTVFNRIAVTAAMVWAAIALLLPPMVTRFFPSFVLFDASRESLRPDMEIASIDYAEPSIVWYFRSRVKGFLAPLSKKNAQEFISRPGPRCIVLPRDQAQNVIVSEFPVQWQRFNTTGFNIPKGKKVDLILLLRPE